MKTRYKRFLVLLAVLLSTLPLRADVKEQLHLCAGTARDGLVTRLPVRGVPPFEMVVVSDAALQNTALNPNVSYDHVDVSISRRTVYVQTPGGSFGIKLVFSSDEFNELHMYDRVLLDLNGCRIHEDVATGSITIDGLTPMNILNVCSGQPIASKEKRISELSDADIYTLVTLKDVEFPFREGAIVNIDENYCQYADGACCPLRDVDGKVLYMAVNTLCPWRKNAAPLGKGNVTGIITWEKNIRYGDKFPKMYLRPLDANSIQVSDNKKTASWKTYLGWFPGRIPGNDLDFEISGTTKSGVDDRLLNNVGPKAFLWTDSGERRIQKASGFNSLAAADGVEQGGAIKFYGKVFEWFTWNEDETVNEGRSIFVEFSAKKIKASALQFCFEMGGGDGNILNTRGVPTRWRVGVSINDGPWQFLSEADGTETFGLRPIPSPDKYDGKYKKTYHLMYANGIGFQAHVYNLPVEALGAQKIVLRITPCEPRWFHLSSDPARDVEYPDATVNLVKKNNKNFSTVRLGTVFIDYKPL